MPNVTLTSGGDAAPTGTGTRYKGNRLLLHLAIVNSRSFQAWSGVVYPQQVQVPGTLKAIGYCCTWQYSVHQAWSRLRLTGTRTSTRYSKGNTLRTAVPDWSTWQESVVQAWSGVWSLSMVPYVTSRVESARSS